MLSLFSSLFAHFLYLYLYLYLYLLMYSLNAIYYNIEKDIYTTIKGASMKLIKDNSAAQYNTTADSAVSEKEQQQWEIDSEKEKYRDTAADDSNDSSSVRSMANEAEKLMNSDSTTPTLKSTTVANTPKPPSAEQSLKIVSLYLLAITLCDHGGSVADGLKFFKKEIQKHESSA